MERLTERHFKKTDCFYMKCSGHCSMEDFSCDDCIEFEKLVNRLGEIENILGDDYDFDRLRELVEADRAGRCVVLPDVDERARQSVADGLQDVFNEWSYEDQTVGLFGMSEGEKELANALIAALKGEQDG